MSVLTFEFSTDPTGDLGTLVVPQLAEGSIVVDDESLTVTLGEPAVFSTRIPRSCIQRVERAPDLRRSTRGAHGWRGRWLINRAATGLVKMTFTQPVPAELTMSSISLPLPTGAIGRLILRVVARDRSIKLRELTVGVDRPQEFICAMGGSA